MSGCLSVSLTQNQFRSCQFCKTYWPPNPRPEPIFNLNLNAYKGTECNTCISVDQGLWHHQTLINIFCFTCCSILVIHMSFQPSFQDETHGTFLFIHFTSFNSFFFKFKFCDILKKEKISEIQICNFDKYWIVHKTFLYFNLFLIILF